MILRITTSCSMGCSHCQGNFQPSNEHMTEETLEKAISFLDNFRPVGIIVTGGEPLEHPQAERFIQRITKAFGENLAFLATNGALLDERLADLIACNIQVVNDPRYYPRRVTPPTRENIMFFEEISSPIYPTGRAKENNIPAGRVSPSCFNLRSMVKRSGLSLQKAIFTLSMRGKFCTPVIDWNGDILLGEVCTCLPVGSINDSLNTLEKNIRAFKCRECGIYANLPDLYRQAVWDT